MSTKFNDLLIAISALSFEDPSTIGTLIDHLDRAASTLAKDGQSRTQIGIEASQIFGLIEQTWITLKVRIMVGDEPKELDLQVLTSLARFTRNLVAGVPDNQTRAYVVEPQIRLILHYFTSLSLIQDTNIIPRIRLLTQTLSNLITDNDDLSGSFWTTCMKSQSEANILLRLLAVSDLQTLTVTFVLMLNAIEGSEERGALLVGSDAGKSVLVALLDHMNVLLDAEESTAAGDVCDMAYQVLRQLFEFGLAITLYNRLENADELVTPYQRTLLRLLDGHLQSRDKTVHVAYLSDIPTLYFSMCVLARTQIRGSTTIKGSTTLDYRLPQVFEALDLLAVCTTTLLLLPDEGSSSNQSQICMENFAKQCGEDSVGAIECTVETLQLLDRLLPRIQMGNAVPSIVTPPSDLETKADLSDPKTFPYVKRDLIRLLGIVCFRNRDAQERMGKCGGVEVVMNHCVIDERNPYLREHAILALRNLLEGNKENQDRVRELKPTQEFGIDGVLRDTTSD